MERFVIDANFVISILDAKDSCHIQAEAILDRLMQYDIELVLNNAVLYEIVSVLSRLGMKHEALSFYQSLKTIGVWFIRLVYLDYSLEERAFFYFKQAKSKNISFFDCTIFATAEHCQSKDIISFDKHLKSIKNFNIINDPKQLSKN